MSFLAPTVSNATEDILIDAIRILDKADSNHEKGSLPVSSDNGLFSSIEAKNIFISVMVSGNWPTLLKKHKKVLPQPQKMPAGYRISNADWWPAPTVRDGLLGLATDKQTDILADLCFTSLMYNSNPNTAKAHFELVKSFKAGHTEGSDLGDVMDVDTEIASQGDTGSIAADDVEPAEPDFAANALPAAWSIERKYRLTRDWPLWPSAGVTSNPVGDATQTRLAVMADNMFESLKIMTQQFKSKSAKKTKGGETNVDAIALANDPGAQELYVSYFDDFFSREHGGKKIKKAGAKGLEDMAEKFMNYMATRKEQTVEWADLNAYTNAAGQAADFHNDLMALAQDDGHVTWYVRACKAYDLYDRAAAGQVEDDVDDDGHSRASATPSLAGSLRGSVIGDQFDDEEEDMEGIVAPASHREAARASLVSRRPDSTARGTAAPSASASASGSSSTRAGRGGSLGSGAGNKRARDTADDGSEEEAVEHDEDDEDDEPPQPYRTSRAKKAARGSKK